MKYSWTEGFPDWCYDYQEVIYRCYNDYELAGLMILDYEKAEGYVNEKITAENREFIS